MKKFITATVSALLAAVLAISFAACAKSDPVKVIDIDLTNEEYGFCVRQDDSALLTQVNAVVARLTGEGIDGVTVDSLFAAEVNKTAQNIGTVATTVSETGKPRSECLVVATNTGFKPFEYKEGVYFAGIDMHIAQILAEELGKTLVIMDMQFDAIVPSVQQ